LNGCEGYLRESFLTIDIIPRDLHELAINHVDEAIRHRDEMIKKGQLQYKDFAESLEWMKKLRAQLGSSNQVWLRGKAVRINEQDALDRMLQFRQKIASEDVSPNLYTIAMRLD
jgi:hypothetical protein